MNGQAGKDRVLYLDTASSDKTLATLSSQSFTEIFPSAADPSIADADRVALFTRLLGIDPLGTSDFLPVIGHAGSDLAINIRELNTEQARLSFGAGDDAFLLGSGTYNRDITVDGGAGNDNVTLDNGARLDVYQFTFNGESGDDLLLADYSKTSLISVGGLNKTLLAVSAGVVSNQFLGLDHGQIYVETSEQQRVAVPSRRSERCSTHDLERN
ncbi:MAG: hypothetical protein U0892_18545 [Pirellulales bacterium]